MRSRSHALHGFYCACLSSAPRTTYPPALTLVQVMCLVRIAASVATWCSERSVHSVALCVASALHKEV
jgi:coenzyme F420-reducing hydrogenase delta subunit